MKMTYAEALNLAIELIDKCEDSILDAETECPKYDTVKEKLTALRDQQIKRNTAERKPTKTQVANVALAERVVEVLRNTDEKLTITQIMDADPVLSELNNQKVTALVRGLGDRVVKTIEKRKSYFQLA